MGGFLDMFDYTIIYYLFVVEARHQTRITYLKENFHSHWKMTFICVTWVSLLLKNFKLKWCDAFLTKLILEPFLMPNHRITRRLPTFRYVLRYQIVKLRIPLHVFWLCNHNTYLSTYSELPNNRAANLIHFWKFFYLNIGDFVYCWNFENS